MYLWPGLPHLWMRGKWSGLAVAVGFAALVNLALLASIVWRELFSSGLRSAVWWVAVAVWLGSAVFSYYEDRRRAACRHPGSADGTFDEALEYYLKGNWYQAERLLDGLLRVEPMDLDARLMLATLFRHTGRFDEAAALLDRLQRLEGSRKWELEIRCEGERLAEAQAKRRGESQERVASQSADPSTEIAHAA